MKHYKSDVERFAQLEYCEFQTADTLHSLEMNAAYIELKESSTAKDAEIEQLKADKAALLECVKWYAEDENHFGQETTISNVWSDNGDRARECIAQIGGTQ